MKPLVSRVNGAVLAGLFVAGSALAQQSAGPSRPILQAVPNGAPLVAKPLAPDYGTSKVTYVQVAGSAFTPTSSAAAWGTTNGYHDSVLRTGDLFPGTDFAAPLNLPQGAVITYLELDGCDNTGGSGWVQGSLVKSDVYGDSTATGFLASDGSGCAYFSEDLTPNNLVVDNFSYHYWLYAVVTQTGAFQIGLSGMVVGYKLQVSPAPATATFLDVPTNHPFFQYIQALSASGITGGCGGGNYCPDNPVTRGQMAVFLAKALGLSF